MSARPWYRRFPSNFISGTLGLTLEEKGAYSIVLDLIYDRGGPIPDEARFIAGVCNCSVRKWNAIREKLLLLGKITITDGMISNFRAEKEIEISESSADERAESGRKGGEKSAENRTASSKISALPQAELKHASASPLPYPNKKDGTSFLKGKKEAPSAVQLDRWADEQLFKACESILGITVPDYQQLKSFPADIVAKARKSA